MLMLQCIVIRYDLIAMGSDIYQIWPDCNIQNIPDAMKGMFLCSVLQLPTALFTLIGMDLKFINIIAASFALLPWVATVNMNLI